MERSLQVLEKLVVGRHQLAVLPLGQGDIETVVDANRLAEEISTARDKSGWYGWNAGTWSEHRPEERALVRQ